jgi:hypothetical protein
VVDQKRIAQKQGSMDDMVTSCDGKGRGIRRTRRSSRPSSEKKELGIFWVLTSISRHSASLPTMLEVRLFFERRVDKYCASSDCYPKLAKILVC